MGFLDLDRNCYVCKHLNQYCDQEPCISCIHNTPLAWLLGNPDELIDKFEAIENGHT
jgi:hypothetical protein